MLVHNGKFVAIVDLDTVAYGDPLEGIGRIEASWYATENGKVYTEAVLARWRAAGDGVDLRGLEPNLLVVGTGHQIQRKYVNRD